MASTIIKHFISQTLHESLCRICLNDDENTLESIYHSVDDHSDLTILQIIEEVAQIKINLNSGLPLVVCLECKEKAILSHMYREECRRTDALFQDTMNQLYRQIIDIEEENLVDGQSIIIVVDEQTTLTSIVKKKDNSEKNDFLEPEQGIYSQADLTQGEIQDQQTLLLANEINNSIVKKEGVENYVELMSDFNKLDEPLFLMQSDLDEQNVDTSNVNDFETSEDKAIKQGLNNQNSNLLKQDLENALQRCPICDKKFVSSERLNRHVLYHETSKTKPICDSCGKSFCNAYHLVKHKLRIHTNTNHVKYTCQYCGKSYKGQNSFDSHIARHEGKIEPKKTETPIAICDYCGLSYTVKYLLEQHILGKHFDIRPHECHECGKCFRSLGTLRGHRIVHTRERDYICSTCNKGFVDRRAFYLHSRLHTGERPFSCETCGRSFVSSNRRNTHRLTAHSLPSKKCSQCPAMFHLQSMVNTHVKKVHMRAHSRRKRMPYDETDKIKEEDISYAYMETDDFVED